MKPFQSIATNDVPKIGDLVYVAQACCADEFAKHVGKIGILDFGTSKHTACAHCGFEHRGVHYTRGVALQGAPLSWFRLIPTLRELKYVMTEEGIREPA